MSQSKLTWYEEILLKEYRSTVDDNDPMEVYRVKIISKSIRSYPVSSADAFSLFMLAKKDLKEFINYLHLVRAGFDVVVLHNLVLRDKITFTSGQVLQTFFGEKGGKG